MCRKWWLEDDEMKNGWRPRQSLWWKKIAAVFFFVRKRKWKSHATWQAENDSAVYFAIYRQRDGRQKTSYGMLHNIFFSLKTAFAHFAGTFEKKKMRFFAFHRIRFFVWLLHRICLHISKIVFSVGSSPLILCQFRMEPTWYAFPFRKICWTNGTPSRKWTAINLNRMRMGEKRHTQ